MLLLHEDFAIYKHFEQIHIRIVVRISFDDALPKYKFKGNAFPIIEFDVSVGGLCNVYEFECEYVC